jgi:hypothetical protein
MEKQTTQQPQQVQQQKPQEQTSTERQEPPKNVEPVSPTEAAKLTMQEKTDLLRQLKDPNVSPQLKSAILEMLKD